MNYKLGEEGSKFGLDFIQKNATSLPFLKNFVTLHLILTN